MAEENLPEVAAGGFEGLKKVNEYSAEYWSARDLQPLLGYNHWRSFEKAVQKSVTSCEQSGNDPSHHFGAGKWSGSARRRRGRCPTTTFRGSRVT